jgi:polyisoprenoid-binding protein YceI
MKLRKQLVIPGLILVLLLAACGGEATPAPEAATSPPEPAAEEADSETSPTEPTAEMAEPTTEMAEPTAEMAEPTAEMAEPTEPEAASGGATTYTIVPEESEARFIVEEVLNGNDKTVVGATNGITGEIMVDLADPSAAQVGTIEVDLSGLATDNNFRNRAVHDAILQTGNPDFQFATFTATSISGLPDTVTVGTPVDFQLTGDLTIHGVTQPTTFDVTVTPVSETRLEGLASTTVTYSDFDVHILRLPDQVASVADTAILELEFAATSG